MPKRKIKLDINSWLPVLIFLLIVIIFGIWTGGRIFAATNLINIFNQSAATIVAGLGMIFVVAMGGTDITSGVIVGLASCFACIAAQTAGGIVMVPIAVATGLASGAVLGFINAKFKVSSFMISLSMLMAYRAYMSLLLSNNAYLVPDSMKFIDDIRFKIVAVIVLVLIITYVFKYTRLGTYVRGIGENENALRHVGINVEKIKIAAFALSGIMAGLAAIFTVVRVGGTNNSIGSGFEMRVMMALFIGGIPVEGGAGSKIYKLIFGAPTIILLENGLVLCGASGGITQLIRGIVLLATVWFSKYMSKKFINVGVEAAQNQKKVNAN